MRNLLERLLAERTDVRALYDARSDAQFIRHDRVEHRCRYLDEPGLAIGARAPASAPVI
jgi:hypothetical protein